MGGMAPDLQLKFAAASYPVSEDFGVGPLPYNMGLSSLPNCAIDFDRQFVVLREVAERHRRYGLCINDPDCNLNEVFPLGYEIPEQILEYPGETADLGAAGAAFFDADGDGFYSAEAGDFPLFATMPEADECCTPLKGDLAVVWFANDLSAGTHGTSQGEPIGADLEQMIYLYFSNSNDEPLYHRVRLVNRRTQTLSNFRFGIFIDGDLGNSSDDLGGSDPSRNMVFFYNGDPFDEMGFSGSGWGSNIPAVAYTSMGVGGQAEAPIVSAIFEDPIAGSNGMPVIATHYYNWLNGIYFNGAPVEGNPEPEAVQFQGYPDGSEGLVGTDVRVAIGFPGIDFLPETEVCYEGAFLVSPNTDGASPTEATAALADIRDLAHSQWSSCFDCVPPVVRIAIGPINGGYGFMNLSEGDTYEWDFGDGNTSNERFPQHVYAASGSYTVTLSISNACGTASGSAVVDTNTAVDQASAEGENMKIYPNPANEVLTVELFQTPVSAYRLVLTDMAGRTVRDVAIAAQRTELTTADLPSGLYTLGLHSGAAMVHRIRIAVQH